MRTLMLCIILAASVAAFAQYGPKPAMPASDGCNYAATTPAASAQASAHTEVNVHAERGRTGKAGARGPQGPQGVPGQNGQNGLNGLNGQDGQDGRDGRDLYIPDPKPWWGNPFYIILAIIIIGLVAWVITAAIGRSRCNGRNSMKDQNHGGIYAINPHQPILASIRMEATGDSCKMDVTPEQVSVARANAWGAVQVARAHAHAAAMTPPALPQLPPQPPAIYNPVYLFGGGPGQPPQVLQPGNPPALQGQGSQPGQNPQQAATQPPANVTPPRRHRP